MHNFKEKIEDNVEEEGISFEDFIKYFNKILKFIKENLKAILVASVIGGLCGFLFAKNQKTKYSALLTFALEEEKSGGGFGGGLSGIASQFGLDLGSGSGGMFTGANLFELMKSRLLVEKALLDSCNYHNEKISLAEYYLRINNIRNGWGKKFDKIQFKPDLDRTLYSREQDSILYLIYSDLSSDKKLIIRQKDKKVTISTLEVINENENFSKIFCEKLAKITSEYYIDIKSKKARTNLDILQRQADSVRLQLNRAIYGYASSGDNVYNLNPAFNVKGSPTKQKQVDVQANTTILTQLLGNIELAKVTLRKETPLIQIIDTPILPLPKINVSLIVSVIIGSLIFIFLSISIILLINLYKKK